MAQIIHTIEVIPPEITPEARAAIEGGRPFHIELQELADMEKSAMEFDGFLGFTVRGRLVR